MNSVCAGHVCDDCNLCRASICCATVPPELRPRLEAYVLREQGLRAAIVAEAGTEPGLGELILAERQRPAEAVRVEHLRPAPLMLPAPPMPLGLPRAAGHVVQDDPEKEAIHVYAQPARQAR